MSYDFALERVCTHEVVMESVSMAPGTLDVIRFPRNPSNQSVTLYIDGVSVPRSGLPSTVRAVASNPGPYHIRSGKSDMLYVKFGTDPARLIPLSPGTVRPSDLARELSLRIPELQFSVSGSRLVIESPLGVPFSFPDPRWTDRAGVLPSTSRIVGALTEIGIVPGRIFSSRPVFPSWELERDPDSPLEGARRIKLSSPLRNRSPVIYLGYYTEAAYCRRCHGSRVEYDYGVVNGTYEVVTNTDLLVQEFDKFLFTRRGSHFKWPWLGSSLIDRIGGKNLVTGASTGSMISMDVAQAFRSYQDVKSQQDQQRFQQVSDDEFPALLSNLSVKVSAEDPTVAIVVVDVLSRSRNPAPLKRLISDPSPFFISGQNTSFRLRG